MKFKCIKCKLIYYFLYSVKYSRTLFYECFVVIRLKLLFWILNMDLMWIELLLAMISSD